MGRDLDISTQLLGSIRLMESGNFFYRIQQQNIKQEKCSLNTRLIKTNNYSKTMTSKT